MNTLNRKGRLRFIFDVVITLEWEGEIEGHHGKGEIEIVDVDVSHDYEVFLFFLCAYFISTK